MHSFPKIPRRVVTGLKHGKSIIVEDATMSNVSEHIPGLVISDMWSTDCMPVNLCVENRIENTLFPNTPRNGSYFRYVHIPPDSTVKELDLYIKSNDKQTPHPFMHKTDTLDYIIILSGEIYLMLEEGETLLKPGDIVIQNGTMHAWSNRSQKPCIQLAILLDAEINNWK